VSNPTRLLPFQPVSMTTAQLAAVSFLARYAGHTHELYSYQLRRWFQWCEANGLDPLVGIQRAHVEFTSGVWARPVSWRPRPTR
jgi:integrase/recombinase XerD